MNKILEELKNNNYSVNSIIKLNSNLIITSNNKKYLLIKKEEFSKEIRNYLKSINCNYYLPWIDTLTNYEVLEYYDSDNNLKELILSLSDIHYNSLITNNYTEEELKSIYEEKVKEIDEVMTYTLKLQDYIEELYYTRNDYYQTIINISKVYNILRTSRYYLDKWYGLNDTSYREVLLIGNTLLSNFIHNQKNYFIDFKNSKRGNITGDIISFYKSNYYDEIYSLFTLYNSKINLTEKELYLFLSSICLVPKISFSNDLNSNLKVIKDYYDYIDRTMSFVLEKDKEYQKTNKEIFKQENNDIKLSSDENKN